MDLLLPALTAFLASSLTLLTGFGLGTILTPVFLLFYAPKIAILMTAVVHLLNNLLKLGLFRRHVDTAVLRRFGLLSLAGALAGAFLQDRTDSSDLKILLGLVLVFLGLKEASGLGESFRLPKRIDFLGGFLSGLLGGFVGNQGAIRSAYLLNYNIPKEAFIATAVIIASIVDVARIPVYVVHNRDVISANSFVLGVTALAAFAGTFAGRRMFRDISPGKFKFYVAGMVVIIGFLLSAGVL